MTIDRKTTISNLETNIRWIEDIECHQFPGWGNVTMAMRDAVELLKEQQETVRCKDCDNRECDGRAGTVVCGITGDSHSRLWFCADGEKKNAE